jgi:hypothetical protein
MGRHRSQSLTLELGRTLLDEGRSAFLLVLGAGSSAKYFASIFNPEVRSVSIPSLTASIE